MIMNGIEAKRVERRYKRRLTELDSLCSRQILILWKKHDGLKGGKSNDKKSAILGKIVGIEWVMNTLKGLQHKEERDLEKHDAQKY